jgi:hypothetical protein
LTCGGALDVHRSFRGVCERPSSAVFAVRFRRFHRDVRELFWTLEMCLASGREGW